MPPLPAEILFGIYLGLLVGTIPALVAWGMGFTFKYVTGVTVPGFGVMILAVALAGVNGGLLALADPAISDNPNAPSIVTAIVVVSMLSLYAHNRGDQMAVEFPRRIDLSKLRNRTISRDLADLVGRDEVRITVVGRVGDMDGYPPLSEELRAELQSFETTFPADLRLAELEERLAERLRSEFDLGDVSVVVDEGGRARILAAPPLSGLSKRITDGRQAVSVAVLVPTGLARGDEVTVTTDDATINGTVLSARSDGGTRGQQATEPATPALPDAAGGEPTMPPRAPTATGGEGRLTLAVAREDVQPLLRAESATIVVESRGSRREFEAVTMLRRADRRFRRLAIPPESQFAGATVGSVQLHDDVDVAVLAVHKSDGWQLGPRARTALDAGDELFAVGTRTALDRFEGSVS